MRGVITHFLLLLVYFGLSQSRSIDSLKSCLSLSKSFDTIYINDLNEIGWQYLDNSTDSSKKYVLKALHLSKELNFTNGLIDSKNTLGILHRYSDENEKAIVLYLEIIELRKLQNRLSKLTGAYGNLGSVYYEINDFPQALTYYLKAFESAKVYLQTDNQIVLLNNIGNVYKSSGLNDLAIESYQNGLKLNKARNDEIQEGQFYVNIANVYEQEGLFKEALRYYQSAYLIFKKTENIRLLSIVLNNLSASLRHLGELKRAAKILEEMQEVADYLKEDDYYADLAEKKATYYLAIHQNRKALIEIEKALQLTDSTYNRVTFANRLLTKSDIYNELANYEQALLFCNRGIAVMMGQNNKGNVGAAYISKSKIYQNMGNYKSSLQYFQLAVDLNDSLASDAFNTKMATFNSLNKLDRKEKELALANSSKEKIEIENKQQSLFLSGSVIIGILVLILLLFSFRAYRVKKKDNQQLNQQKQEIQEKNKTLHVRQIELEHQKLVIEEKQKEILDSIHYAKRIQQTLLANRSLINRNLPENFILFKPKDIVSGDFYWAAEKGEYFYLAVCDSTGHGVPGAFMSLLNITFLNEAINEKNVREPQEVLNHVRQKLIESVSQDGGQDGMDCILICLNKTDNSISYSAAKNALLKVSGNELFEFQADKMPVGKGEVLDSFKLRQLNYKKGDFLYLYSDGFADQFGGPRGKKFKSKALHEQLLACTSLPVKEQEKMMDKIFEDWRGDLEQIDDVLLIGIRM